MILETRIANANWFHRTIIFLTFLATKSTTSRAAAKQPAAILAVIRLVDARMKTIPQNDEPRSGCRNDLGSFLMTRCIRCHY